MTSGLQVKVYDPSAFLDGILRVFCFVLMGKLPQACRVVGLLGLCMFLLFM